MPYPAFRQDYSDDAIVINFDHDGPHLLQYEHGRLTLALDRETLLPAPVYGPLEDPATADARTAAFQHSRADEAKVVSRCYFIGGDTGAIKIGHSVDPVSRLRHIAMCSPIPLRILATRPGGEARESAYHTQFAKHRLHGEWFSRCPEIEAEIARLSLNPLTEEV